jgi:Lon protease-like protein
MALLRPGWETAKDDRPPLHPMVCVGRIAQEERLPDGRYNLLVQGVCRARIREEAPTEKLYRQARVELVQNVPVSSAERTRDLRHLLGQGVVHLVASRPQALEQLQQLLASDLSLGDLCDILGFAMPLDLEVKQQLLEENRVEERVIRLLAGLAGKTPAAAEAATRRRFPPEFSSN